MNVSGIIDTAQRGPETERSSCRSKTWFFIGREERALARVVLSVAEVFLVLLLFFLGLNKKECLQASGTLR